MNRVHGVLHVASGPPDDLRTELLHETLVEEAQRIFARQFEPARYPGLSWDAPEWRLRPVDAGSAETRTTSTWRAVVPSAERHGAADDTDSPALPAYYADLWKAFLIHRNVSADNAPTYARASRYLWWAIAERLRGQRFRWDDLRSEDFYRAEAVAPHQVTGRKLRHFLDWLEREEVIDPIAYEPKAVTSGSVELSLSREGMQRRLDRLPTRSAILGLAEVYRKHATMPADRVLICAVGLMLLTGLRITELVTLPLDCWHEEIQRGRRRCAIRYWNLKEGSRRRRLRLRWLSPLAADLAQTILTELRELTNGARERARVLEGAPGAMPLKCPSFDLSGREELSFPEAARALGYSSAASLSTRISKGELALTPLRTEGRRAPRVMYERAAVERYLQEHAPAKRGLLPHGRDIGPVDLATLLGISPSTVTHLAKRHGFPKRRNCEQVPAVRVVLQTGEIQRVLLERQGSLRVWRISKGHYQTLSETLLIMPGNYNQRARPLNHLLVEHVSASDVRFFLVGGSGVKSVFERNGITEAQDSSVLGGSGRDAAARPARMRPHAARHWINTLAHRAGMTSFQITVWMGRADPQQTRLYLHRESSAFDLVDFARNGVVDGTFAGRIVEQYNTLPPDAGQRFIAAYRTAHALATGLCTVDLVAEECGEEKVCERCPKWLSGAHLPDAREALMQRRGRWQLSLERFDSAEAGGHRVQEQQRRLARRALEVLDRLLSVAPNESDRS